MCQRYVIYAALDWLTIILEDMLPFETVISLNFERLRNYVVESSWRITASGDACQLF